MTDTAIMLAACAAGVALVLLPHIVSVIVSILALGLCLYVGVPMALEYYRN